MYTGLLELPAWGYVAVTLGMTHITIAAVTIYLHRHQAHRALSLHPGLAHVFRFWLWLTTGMVTRQWVAIHRKHHAFVETPADPHSPEVFGLRTLLLRGGEVYRAAAKDREFARSWRTWFNHCHQPQWRRRWHSRCQRVRHMGFDRRGACGW